jgi:hypothetical protein
MRGRYLLAALALSSPASGQTVERYGGCFDAIRCVIHKDTTEAMRRETGTALYVLSSSLVVSSNLVYGWDLDAGGYPNRLYWQKEAFHAASAAVLTESAIAIHVRPAFAVIWTNIAGLGFEFSQGHVNGYDLAANAVGSLFGAFLADRLRFR